jgi:uncharacterized protein (UPF0248 family)
MSGDFCFPRGTFARLCSDDRWRPHGILQVKPINGPHLDRHEGTIQRVRLDDVIFPEGERRVFELSDDSGQVRRIPFHRVREVWRDGEVIWKRPVLSNRKEGAATGERGPADQDDTSRNMPG